MDRPRKRVRLDIESFDQLVAAVAEPDRIGRGQYLLGATEHPPTPGREGSSLVGRWIDDPELLVVPIHVPHALAGPVRPSDERPEGVAPSLGHREPRHAEARLPPRRRVVLRDQEVACTTHTGATAGR